MTSQRKAPIFAEKRKHNLFLGKSDQNAKSGFETKKYLYFPNSSFANSDRLKDLGYRPQGHGIDFGIWSLWFTAQGSLVIGWGRVRHPLAFPKTLDS
jgi:hypothetical protein